MGELFKNLCKGPVIVIDDELDEKAATINNLVNQIEKYNLPIIKYKSISHAQREIQPMLFSNFIILDWAFKTEGIPLEVVPGEERRTSSSSEVIQFIKEAQQTCLAPIFILSALPKGEIIAELEQSGLIDKDHPVLFIEEKQLLCNSDDALVSKIEEWMESSSYVYLSKWWTNEGIKSNTKVFWELYTAAAAWSTIFYKSFKEDGVDPKLNLVATLSELVYGEIGKQSLDSQYIENNSITINEDSLKRLYGRLMYIQNEIDKEILAGDIYKFGGAYYLNIRPDCDTTNREDDDIEIYLLKGKPVNPNSQRIIRDEKNRIIEREGQIILPLLDGHDIVEFSAKKINVKKHGDIKDKKIYRISTPFITRIRQRFSSFVGRFGVPKYPKELMDSIFGDAERSILK